MATKMTAEEIRLAGILIAAHEMARLAVMAELKARPEDPMAFDCGFAWVTISGSEPMARFCRKQIKAQEAIQGKGRVHDAHHGDKGYPKGWQWWKPGNHYGQSIRVHEAGARAFRDCLATVGIVATVGSRLD